MTLGKERKDQLVPTGFMLPGFIHREESVSETRLQCVFWSPTGYVIGQRMINEQVVIEEETGERGFGVEVGVDAGGNWLERNRLIRLHSGDAIENLELIKDKVTKLKNMYFEALATMMQREFERGLEFVVELKSIFLVRFPDYNQVLNRYDELKMVMFVKDLEEVIILQISRGEFAICVSEVEKIKPGDECDRNIFAYEGQNYWCHDMVAVWYPTEKRHIAYDPDDTSRRTEMLGLSLDTLENYLDKKR